MLFQYYCLLAISLFCSFLWLSKVLFGMRGLLHWNSRDLMVTFFLISKVGYIIPPLETSQWIKFEKNLQHLAWWRGQSVFSKSKGVSVNYNYIFIFPCKDFSGELMSLAHSKAKHSHHKENFLPYDGRALQSGPWCTHCWVCFLNRYKSIAPTVWWDP